MTGNGENTAYENGDDWGMVDGIAIPTSQKILAGWWIQTLWTYEFVSWDDEIPNK